MFCLRSLCRFSREWGLGSRQSESEWENVREDENLGIFLPPRFDCTGVRSGMSLRLPSGEELPCFLRREHVLRPRAQPSGRV